MFMKEYFSLTSFERNGLFALFILALAFLLFIKMRQVTYEPELVDLSTLQDSVEAFYNSPKISPITTTKYPREAKVERRNNYKPKATSMVKDKPLPIIEINAATAKELTVIKGVGEFYAKNIVEERKRRGGFSHPDQLLSVYGMTAEKLNSMLAQIRIDSTLCLARIPLNTSDSLQLAEVYIIDTHLASRIVRYRERLGGFYDARQLLDIFSIDEELYLSLMTRLFLDTVQLRSLDVNNANFKTIMKHPYISSYKNTKAIFRYLDYGAIGNWEEFYAIPNLALDNPEGLKYYIKFLPILPKADEDSVPHK